MVGHNGGRPDEASAVSVAEAEGVVHQAHQILQSGKYHLITVVAKCGYYDTAGPQFTLGQEGVTCAVCRETRTPPYFIDHMGEC